MLPLLIYTTVFAFIFGACIGSFLNVVIYRVPESLSIVRPASRCPSCETPIAWYDNLPVLSWFLLRGSCRNCEASISLRYPLIEFATGLVSAGIWYMHFSPMLQAGVVVEALPWAWAIVPWILHFIFCALLIVITFVDLDHFLIPHEFTLPGMVLGLASPWIFEFALHPEYVFVVWPPITPWTSFIGFLAGGLTIIVIFYGYLAVRGVEGLGGGDATMMAMVGAWLGWPALPFVFFAASLQGVLAAGVSKLFGAEFVKDSGRIFVDPDSSSDEVEVSEERPVEQDDGSKEPVVSEGISPEASADPEKEDFDETGFGAVPFGPFIALAAFQYLIFGKYLPAEFSMRYFFY